MGLPKTGFFFTLYSNVEPLKGKLSRKCYKQINIDVDEWKSFKLRLMSFL